MAKRSQAADRPTPLRVLAASDLGQVLGATCLSFATRKLCF